MGREFKIVLLGEGGGGKTSISERLSQGIFDPNTAPTVGYSYVKSTYNVGGLTVTLNLWDTCGQEKFQSLVPLYMRNAHALIFVFDVSSERAMASLKGVYDAVSDQIEPEMVCYLCGNKTDLVNLPEMDWAEFENWGSSHNMTLELTSAKTGSGIKDMFNDIAKDMVSCWPDGKRFRSKDVTRSIIGKNDEKNGNCC
jgi:small GTP-binding protein